MEYKKFKVAGYLRLSQEDGDKEVSDSIVSQRTIIENKIKELGEDFELADFYIDDGYTGLNTDRPAFQKMLSDIEKGIINAVITKDLSRLSRNSFEANYYIEIYFLERNIRYISVLDNVDTYIKNSNNDMIQFKTLINDWYSKDISKKVRTAVWARKEKGLYLGALAPYGYDKARENKNQLVINESQAEVIRLIFDMFDNGATTREIAEHLKKQKIKCPSYYDFGGAKNGEYNWKSETVRRLLKNKVYLGHTEYGKRLNLSYKSKKVKTVPREDWKIVKNTHEPIIFKEQFERVQGKLEIRKKVRNPLYVWNLNGIVYCKECGTKMQVKVRRDKNHEVKYTDLICGSTYRNGKIINCARKYKAFDEKSFNKIIYSIIDKKLNKIVNSDKLEEIITNQYNNNATKLFDDNIELLKKKLKRTENIISSLYIDLKEEIIDLDDYKRLYQNEQERKISIQSNIESLQREKDNRTKISKDQIIKVTKDLLDSQKWTAEMLSEIIYNIQIDKENKIYINYKYDIFMEV